MNPFYNRNNESIPARPNNLGDMLQNFASQFIPQGMNPEQFCKQLIQNGQMTQAQFESYSKIADAWTRGGRY